jgi:hypothetical protein
MTDIVALEIPAEPSLLRVVRMVVGGLAAQVDLSFDEIDDIHMAVEEVFYACHPGSGGERCRLRLSAAEDRLRLEMGPLTCEDVVRRLHEPTCSLIARVVDLEVEEGAEGVSVVLTKRREVQPR